MENTGKHWGLFSVGLVIGTLVGFSMGTDEGKKFSRRLIEALEKFWQFYQPHHREQNQYLPSPPTQLPQESSI